MWTCELWSGSRNCSDQNDFTMIVGCTMQVRQATGIRTWAPSSLFMARFNRIYIEVLSVIAQQLPGTQRSAQHMSVPAL